MTAEPTSHLELQLPTGVRETLRRAAELQDLTLNEFIVTAAHDAALRLIDKERVIPLSAEDQHRIAQALINPPAPNTALKRAVRRHRRWVEVR